MKRFFTLTILTAAVAATSAFGATITAYTNSVAFGTALSTSPTVTLVEGFSTSSSSIFQFTFNISSFASTTTARGSITGGGAMLDEADQGRLQNTVINLISGSPMYAFGADWNLSPNGAGSGLKILLNFVGGGTQTLAPTLGVNVGDFTSTFFYGFTSDTAIASVQILPAGSVTETFTIDNVTAATVPEPSTFGLMGLALVGLGALRTRRK